LPFAIALAYFIGYALLPRDFAAFVPQPNQSWQWLPYLGLGTAGISTLAQAFPRWRAWNLSVLVAAPLVAAAITPAWPIFGLARPPLIGLFAIYLLVVGISLQQLPPRLLNLSLLCILAAAAVLLALTIGALVSVRLSQLAGIGAGALAGIAMAGVFGAQSTEWSLRSIVPVFVALVGGAAVIGAVEPDPPKLGLLAIPLLPLATWLMVAIPIRRGG